LKRPENEAEASSLNENINGNGLIPIKPANQDIEDDNAEDANESSFGSVELEVSSMSDTTVDCEIATNSLQPTLVKVSRRSIKKDLALINCSADVEDLLESIELASAEINVRFFSFVFVSSTYILIRILSILQKLQFSKMNTAATLFSECERIIQQFGIRGIGPNEDQSIILSDCVDLLALPTDDILKCLQYSRSLPRRPRRHRRCLQSTPGGLPPRLPTATLLPA
jgi:hypothetical protein